MMLYKGKPVTVVTTEMLVRALIDYEYLPPTGSDAHEILLFGDWDVEDIWNYMNTYVEDRPR